MTRNLITLPEGEQEILQKIRESQDLNELRRRVYALRQAKWPLRAIGDALGAPRSTVRMWELGADENSELPDVPECPRAVKARGERVVRLRMDVPPEDRDKLRELAKSARQVRGRTPKDAKIRRDAEELDKMIESYIARKVPVKRIAGHMGVTPRAVTARYERYQERKSNG